LRRNLFAAQVTSPAANLGQFDRSRPGRLAAAGLLAQRESLPALS
jgi:hypothetical protein